MAEGPLVGTWAELAAFRRVVQAGFVRQNSILLPGVCTVPVPHSHEEYTLKIDDETYRRARMRAARGGTSVSAMVRDFLTRQEDEDSERDNRRIAALDEIYALAEARAKKRSKQLKPLTRDEIYGDRVR